MSSSSEEKVSQDERLPRRKSLTGKPIGHVSEDVQLSLSQKLKARADRQLLVERLIIREPVSPRASALQEKQNRLNDLLEKRRSRKSLMLMNVIKEEDKNVSTARFTAAQREFAKAKRADKLANFIASRPSRNTLEQRSIIIDEADKRSALNEARRALGTLMVNRPRPEMLKESNVLPDIGDLPVDDSLGERGNISVPTCVDSIDTPISKCGLGFNSSMLLDTHGHVYVFGSSSNGRLGLGNTDDLFVIDPTPIPLLKALGRVNKIAAGDNHCAALVGNQVYTWGQGSWGRLGHGDQSDHHSPMLVKGVLAGKEIDAVSCGSYHTLCVSKSGKMYTFGWNKNGRLGLGASFTSFSSNEPVEIDTNGVKFVAISAGASHSLAIDADGHVWSWGANLNGALGRNGTSDSDLIGQIEGVDDISFTNISAGDGFSVAVSSEGIVYTWGSNTKGQLGRETTEEKEQILPTKVSIPTPIIDISTGRAFSFAVGKDGSVYSWGSGQHGVLGHGDTKRQKTPKKVEGVTSVQHVDCGVFHAALITEKGQVFVVGSKNDGRIGL